VTQPDGFTDNTNCICLLEKTLYGLKQSSQEWNIELDKKMHKHGYMCLHADPCVYVQQFKGQQAIITIWVDDLLLFASTNKAMERIKSDLQSEWEITDLSKPLKIIRIKITCDD